MAVPQIYMNLNRFINSQAGASVSLLVVAILRQKPLNPVEVFWLFDCSIHSFPQTLGLSICSDPGHPSVLQRFLGLDRSSIGGLGMALT